MRPYVAEDSFGYFIVLAGDQRGADLADFIDATVRKTDPELFVRAAAAVAVPPKGNLRAMTATQRLAAANGDEGPKL